MSLNDTLAELARKGKERLDKARQGVEGVVDNVQEQLGDKGSIAGAVAYHVGEGVKKGKRLHEEIQRKGGYAQTICDRVDYLGDRLYDRFDDIERALFTKGKFDAEKAKAALGDGARATAVYGVKAVRYISRAASGAGEAIGSLKNAFPSKWELDTKYKGIGSDYHGILFRPHFEDCLKFYAAADGKISPQSRNKPLVLDDIKASASSSIGDLVGYYQEKAVEHPEVLRRMSTAMKYLSGEHQS